MFYFGRFRVLFLLLLLHQWKEASEEFSADHRSLENEMGVGICLSLFFFDSTLLLLLWRFNRPNETESGSGGD